MRRLFPADILRDLDLILQRQSGNHLDVQSVGEAGFDELLLKLLGCGCNLDKSRIFLKLQQALFDGQYIIGPLEDNIGIGAVACSDKLVGFEPHIGFDLELNGSVF